MKPSSDLNDMEYLAKLGFEKVPAGNDDLTDLQQKIRKRSNISRSYFASFSFILGGLIGMGALLLFNRLDDQQNKALVAGKVTTSAAEIVERPEVSLDTVEVVHENFVNVQAFVHNNTRRNESSRTSRSDDSLLDIPIKQPVISFPEESMRPEKVKFILNSSIIYIHDLKVSDYRRLYFKSDQFVPYTGFASDHLVKDKASYTGSRLKQSADYFLHEELGNALLNFKRGDYDLCISSLNMVSGYNKEDVNCSFYLGMSYYHKKNYKRAIDNFEKCIRSSNNAFCQEAIYYKALSLIECGKEEEGKVILRQIVIDDGFYADKAKERLN